ncbi:hypothetical protein Acr_02g0013620 [Actinidia rufa]|uniref:Reverse transcriptase zinc-binding domain-containing protein n=1 Tax=Actinidia rufa TaxID=165716 RepID=A0A7J0E9Y1_9ERIC|nr:hypothetical protein Acr_02g0013620 [Actinidia rufa]
MAHTPPNFKPNVSLSDKVVWVPADDGFYSVKSAWKSVRLPKPKVPWLTVWGMGVDPSWVLCLPDAESHEHLFFRCSFSGQIWSRVLSRFQVIWSPNGWSEELEWATGNWINPGFGADLYKLVLADSFYHIWWERDARIFRNKTRNVDAVFKTMEREVRDRCCSWDMVENTLSNWLLCLSWSIPTRILKIARH